jgi:hypothetical protein
VVLKQHQLLLNYRGNGYQTIVVKHRDKALCNNISTPVADCIKLLEYPLDNGVVIVTFIVEYGRFFNFLSKRFVSSALVSFSEYHILLDEHRLAKVSYRL